MVYDNILRCYKFKYMPSAAVSFPEWNEFYEEAIIHNHNEQSSFQDVYILHKAVSGMYLTIVTAVE